MTQVITVELETSVFRGFTTPRDLRVVAVQLDSPIPDLIKADGADQRLQWDSRAAEQGRIDRVAEALEALVQGSDDRTSPDIVLFPEYSVPEAAHADGAFQSFADGNHCILVPGTYYSNSRDGLDRRNVCKIYVPGRTEPIVIVKRHPSPKEAKYLSEDRDHPNILQMLLPIAGRAPVSLNIFVCRDYLLPYDEGCFDEVAKLWSYEGINFVLMQNEEARLFEGQAASEVRRLRGPGRIVFFINNASACRELGSALLGPAAQRERDDVVKSIPWDREGMLVAWVRPWDIRDQIIRPDLTYDSPISNVSVSYFEAPSEGLVMLQPGDQPPAYRAVWKPAFLEAISRVIVLDLRVARRLSQTIRVLSEKNARIYAVAIRGVQDVIIRRYAYHFEREMGDIPPLASFFTGLSENDLAELFESPRGVLQIMVYPKGIWKYRGMNAAVEPFSAQAAELKRELEVLKRHNLNAYMDRLDEVGSFASQAERELGVGEHLKSYFFPELEENIPIGYEFNNNIRETYILISLARADNRLRREFEDEILKGELMADGNVREIFVIGKMEGDDLHFEYLVKLKGRDYETDKVIRRLRMWQEDEEVSVQTRTFDVTDYLKNRSVLGIANFDQGTSMSEFEVALRKEDRRHLLAQIDFERPATQKKMATLATEWSKVKATDGASDDLQISERIDEVYVSIWFLCFVGNFGSEEYLQRAKLQLLGLYLFVEGRALEVLGTLIKVDGSVSGPAMGRLVEEAYPQVKRNSNWVIIRDHPEKVLLTHIMDMVPGFAQVAEVKRELASARSAVNRASDTRNTFAHRNTVTIVEFIQDAESPTWDERLQNIGGYINDVLLCLKMVERIYSSLD